MTIKLDALTSWKLVPKGEALPLRGDLFGPRRIRLDLNCEDKTWIYVESDEIEAAQGVDAMFIAAVGPGLETVEFYASGDVVVRFVAAVPEDQKAQVWIYTAEIEPNVSAVPEAVSFTEIHQRRARNPELEYMQFIARQNERRMDEKLAQLDALLAEKEKANVNPGTPPATPPEPSAKSDGGDQAPSGEKPAGGSEQPSGAGNDPAA